MPTPKIHTYALNPPASSPAPPATTLALRFLRDHLPTSLTLYRRLQAGYFSPQACLLSNLSLEMRCLAVAETPWLLTFCDRGQRPETEVWAAASWEAGDDDDSDESAQDALVRALVAAMADLPVATDAPDGAEQAGAETLTATPEKDHAGLSRATCTRHMTDRSIMLWGAVHARTVAVLARCEVLHAQFCNTLVPYHNYLLRTSALPADKELPDGLRWGELSAQHFSLVRSRTQIPRLDRTLAILPNLAIYPTSASGAETNVAPIAWAFIGLDSSLTTLHVEPEWRGKGLAKQLSGKIFKEKTGAFAGEGEKCVSLACSMVMVGNVASERVCTSLGGRSEWQVYWVRVDLGKVAS